MQEFDSGCDVRPRESQLAFRCDAKPPEHDIVVSRLHMAVSWAAQTEPASSSFH